MSRAASPKYKRVFVDPVVTVGEAYDYNLELSMNRARQIVTYLFGEEFPEKTRSEMVVHQKTHQKNRHGKHSYKLEDFGLSVAMIQESTRDYCETYQISKEN